MKHFREYLLMGGNVVLGNDEAQRIDLNKISRSEIVQILTDSLDAINKSFRKQTGFPLWNASVFSSREFLSGSAFHFFNVKEIDDTTFASVKNSVGDIDTQVNGLHADFIRKFLDTNQGKIFKDLKLLGYKVSGDQIISLWKSKTYDMNIQIDLELVAYDDSGRPSDWSKFSHSSAWEDLLKGIKGVAHKYIFRALNAKDLKEVIIQPKTARGKEKIVTSAEVAFSTSGLRPKLKPVMQDGVHLMKDGKPVYHELSTAETGFVTDLGAIFAAFFGHPPSKKEEDQMQSFTGVLELIKTNYNKAQQVAVADGFANTLWGPQAQSMYRNDNERDLQEKMVMAKVLANRLGLNTDRWSKLIGAYYK